MDEKKELKQEESEVAKKKATKTTTRKTTAKQPVKKPVAETRKKAGTKTTIKKAEVVKTNVDVKEKPVKVEKIEKVEAVKEQQPKEVLKKTVEQKKEVKEPKFEPVEKIEKKKKKHRLLKTILILIIIALVLFLIHFARNCAIIKNIFEKQEYIDKATNYSFIANYGTSEMTIEYYHKNSTEMLIRMQNKDNMKVIIWHNKDTRETIFLNPKELTATIQKGEGNQGTAFDNMKPKGLACGWKESRGFDFLYWITSEKVNGKDCYKVTWLVSGESSWYNKEDGTLAKTTNGRDSSEYEVEYTRWEFNKLTEEDMSRPNLMGYEIKENK